MRVLMRFVHLSILFGHLSLCIRLPGQKVDKDTLTSLGIKTLDWQGEDNAQMSLPQVHHNYSKVFVHSVQGQNVSGFPQGGFQKFTWQSSSFSNPQTSQSGIQKFTSQSSSFGNDHTGQDFYQSQVSGFGQKAVDEDDYFDLTSQSEETAGKSQHQGGFSQVQHGGSSSFHSWSGGQQQIDLSSGKNEHLSGASQVQHGGSSSHSWSGGQQQVDLNLDDFSEYPDSDQDQLVSQSSQGQSHVNQNQQSSKFTNPSSGNGQHFSGSSQVQQGGSSSSHSWFGGQQQVDLGDYADGDQSELVSQSSQGQSHVNQNQQGSKFTNVDHAQSQSSFANQNQNSHTSTLEGQSKDDYDDQSADLTNSEIYNAHSYGNPPQLNDVMEAESYLQSQQQFEDFPDYELGELQLVDQNAESSNVDQEERQAKKFYTLNKPIYIHGYKYPPDPKDFDPIKKQTPVASAEIYTKCPKMATGQYVYAESCNQFLNCWKGRGFIQNCAPGTLFNPKTLECDFASKVQCVTGPRKPDPKPAPTSQKIKISCPAEFSGVVPHHTDCSKFINCANGVEHVMDCPPGTLFSLKINNCDFPYRAECASWSTYFGNISDYSSQSGGAGKFYIANGGSHQGGDTSGSYEQSSGNKFGHKYISTDDFRLHQGSGINTAVNQNQGSVYQGSSQQSGYGHGQGSSITNQDVYKQNAFGSGQSVASKVETQQTGQHPNQGFYIVRENPNQYQQGQQQPGQNLHGAASQHAVSTQTGSQGAYHGSSSFQTGSSGQGSTVLGENYYEQSQHAEGQGQYHHGTQSQGHNIYEQNQDTSRNKNHFAGSQHHYLGGSQSLDRNQDQHLSGSQGQYLGGSQGQYLGGSQGQYFGGRQGQYLDTSQYIGRNPNQVAGGTKFFDGQSQINYNQNEEVLENQDYLQGQNQENFASQQLHGFENTLNKNQGQYSEGNQQLYGHHQQLYEKNTNKNLNQGTAFSSPSKYAATEKPTCPEGFTGLRPHPSDCSKFLNCANGQTFVQDCGPGTVFNPDSKVCDFPYKVKCQESKDYSKLIDIRMEPKPSAAQQHQEKQETGSHSHYTSQGGSAANQWQIDQDVDGSRSKGQSQHYQGQAQTSSGVYQQTRDHSGSLSKSQDYYSKSGSQGSITFGSDGIAKCPQHASGLYPHPTICSKFLNCAGGQTVIQDCGPGTVFNPTSKVCDFPYKVKCQQSEDYSKLINIRTEQHRQNQDASTHDHYVAQGSSDQISGASQWQLGQDVDESRSKDHSHVYGGSGKTQISSGVYQEILDSSESSSTAQNYHFTSDSQKLTTFETTGVVKCPQHATGFYPHPTICSKFLNCADGKTVIQDCSPGTVFNPKNKMCGFAHVECGSSAGEIITNKLDSQNQKHDLNQQQGFYGQSQIGGAQQQGSYVQGQTSSGVYEETLDNSKSSSTGQNHHSTSGSHKLTTFGTTGVVKCPQHATGLYPHPTTCSKFLNCADGKTVIQDCGPGTVFNPKSKMCDFAYNVECGSSAGEVNTNLLDSQNQKHDLSQQQGFYGQSQIGGGALQSSYGHGQTSITSVTNQQELYNQNPLTDTSGDQHRYYGQSSSGNKQQQGFYDQNQIDSSKVVSGEGTHSVTGQNSYDQSQTDSSKVVNSQGTHGVIRQGSYGHSQIDSSKVVSGQGFHGSAGQGSYGQSQIDTSKIVSGQGSHGVIGQGSYSHGQTGSSSTTGQKQHTTSTWEQQEGFYGQTKGSSGHQPTQEANHQIHGSSTTHHHKWYTQTGSQGKPIPFPSTDINADYEFGGESGGLEVDSLGSQSKVIKPTPKRKTYCEPLDYRCSVDDCIPQSMVCDGTKDCPDGSDEQKCEKYVEEFALTPNTILAVREKEKFLNISLIYCAKSCVESKGFKCKSFSYRKDDGACFLSDLNVGRSGALIISHPYDYYELKSFTVDCTHLYKCPNQKCINFKQVCDGVNDCGDRTDEKGCNAQAFGYQVRLSGTDKKHEGRIEIKAFGRWGYVCDDKFGLRDADVVCKEVGFPLGSLEVKANSYYAQELKAKDVFYLMDDVTCLGNETTLRDCDFNGWGVSNCEPQEVVGVVCKTPLETCPKDHWKCDSSQECIPLNFVCDGVFDCTDQSDEANKHCEAPVEIRLANGKSKHEGRVEIRYHGIWGTVCDDDFNDDSAKVVCKHLGFPGKAVAKKDGYFGAGEGPIWLDQVFCQGNESSLEHCMHWNWGEHNCEHAEDVGVVCNSTYDNTGHERNVKIGQRNRDEEALPEYLFPDRCGFRKDDQFLEEDDVHFRVVKGSSANKGDYPWQASLRIKNKLKPIHWCGAVVISQKYVLTAAHCLAGFAKGAYFVVAGDYNTDEDEGTEQEAYIEEFFIHEEFRVGQKMNNDIAVIKLKGQGFTFTKDVQPICLPDADLEYQKGLNCTISGFGTIESGKSGYSHTLRAGWIPLQSREVCQMPHVYGSTITEGMICAGSLDEGVDACDGDSGGPLACLHDGLFTLYGLTSWGHHCGYANKPGVYVKVSHYRKWIDETMKKLS